MLDALESRNTSSGIEIGIFDSGEAIKAFNHNTGDTLPARPFIPSESEGFKQTISSGVKGIVRSFEEGTQSGLSVIDVIQGTTPRPSETTAVSLADIFGRSFFDDLFEGI